jgi:hypothetical protein
MQRGRGRRKKTKKERKSEEYDKKKTNGDSVLGL